MDLAQTKIVGLTMELDLKAKEFKMLCEKLEEAKKRITDPNDERLLWFKELFERNNKEITEINKQLKELQDAEIDKQESFNPDNIFDNKKVTATKNEKSEEVSDDASTFHLVKYKQSIFKRVINKIKMLFFFK